MKVARTSDRNHWINVGRTCFQKGWDISVALTQSESINELIRQGYEAAEAKKRQGKF